MRIIVAKSTELEAAKVRVVQSKTGAIKLANKAIVAVSRHCLHRGLGTMANHLLTGTIYCGWVQRRTSTGLLVARYLVLACDDWPDVEVREGLYVRSPRTGMT